MRKYLKYGSFVLVIIAAIIIIQCAVNPVTGKKEIMLISENMEIQMGKEIDQSLKMEYGMYDDIRLRDYIVRIGDYMAPNTHRQNLQYHFAVLDTPVENAFAAPGGYIYITRGLMALLNSEAELATVIGHELGHVNARHSARQMTKSILFTVGIVLASELSKDFRKIAPLAFVGSQLLFLKYSRDDEYQADQLGFEYAIKTGYNSREMVSFFSTLERMTADEGGIRLPNFLSTHPLTPKRIAKIKEYVQVEETSNPGRLAKLKVERNTYINMVNGLVYGDNPRQGFVEGNAFYHPDMKFCFNIPHGWKVSNTPRQVTMASEDENAIILLQTEETSESLEDYSQKMAKNLTTPKVLRKGYREINGMNAFHSVMEMVSQPDDTTKAQDSGTEKMDVTISCIRKDDMVYSFFSVTEDKNWRRYNSDINNTVNSFRPLNNSKYLNRQPKRIYVNKVQGNQTLQNYLTSLNIPRESWNTIALMNSMQLYDTISPNRLVKIIK